VSTEVWLEFKEKVQGKDPNRTRQKKKKKTENKKKKKKNDLIIL
jgi:hypothetical protein